MEFKNESFSIKIEENRNCCSSGLLITLLTEDDENWSEKYSFDAYWFESYFQVVKQAHDSLKKNKKWQTMIKNTMKKNEYRTT